MPQQESFDQGPAQINSTEDYVAHWMHVAVIVTTISFLIILATWLIISGSPASLDLRVNFFGILSGVALVANLIAVILIIRAGYKAFKILF